MNAVVRCIAPEKWWADQRAKRRTVVLVIVLFFYAWLTAAEHLSPLEAAGMVTVIGIAAGVVLDRVVDGTRPGSDDLSTLLRLVAGSGRS
jgi:lipoprotein signal peptidase